VNPPTHLTRGAIVRIFLAFACAYFFSALLRAVTATLAPAFSAELGLQAADLGLLAGSYFLGFSLMQLPLGAALDRVGPRRVLLTLTGFAVVGCAAFALADGLLSLALARALIGVGVAAGLMAPLTCYRLRFSPQAQLRANSWMLMTGSLGMVASTLPVQWLLPIWGWRGLFWGVSACLLACMLLMWRWVPIDVPPALPSPQPGGARRGYGEVVRHPVFQRSAPIGFFVYGGLIAMQSLWAWPWLTRVAGWQPQEAASGLFVINVGMLLAFMTWGAVMPRLVARGIKPDLLIARGLPLNLLVLTWIVVHPEPAGAVVWTLWCVSTTFVSLSQPAVAQAFAAELAGRALSAFNLVIFSGVFAVQWGIGLVIDGFLAAGFGDAFAFRAAFGLFGLACGASYLWFLWARPDRRTPAAASAQ
jgi:predicted MFS family arabinose efflux permease